jgi:hypothetical protein
MVAEAEVMHQQPAPVLEVQYSRCVTKGVGMSAVAVPEVAVGIEVAVELPSVVSCAAQAPVFLCSYANLLRPYIPVCKAVGNFHNRSAGVPGGAFLLDF